MNEKQLKAIAERWKGVEKNLKDVNKDGCLALARDDIPALAKEVRRLEEENELAGGYLKESRENHLDEVRKNIAFCTGAIKEKAQMQEENAKLKKKNKKLENIELHSNLIERDNLIRIAENDNLKKAVKELYIPVYMSLFKDPKMIKMIVALDCRSIEVWPHLVLLWTHCLLYYQDGDITELVRTPKLLGKAIETRGSKFQHKFIAQLVQQRFVDVEDLSDNSSVTDQQLSAIVEQLSNNCPTSINNYSFKIHNWFSKGAGQILVYLQNERERKANAKKKPDEIPAETPRNSGVKSIEKESKKEKEKEKEKGSSVAGFGMTTPAAPASEDSPPLSAKDASLQFKKIVADLKAKQNQKEG